ncbi:MAG TPA: hypothetical protein VHS33_05060 [Sphingomicrobium sp.]|nr:hypothetical protein [Sphingomicrobium sp.]
MRTPNWTTLGLVGGLVVLVLVVAYFAAMRSSDQDKLSQNEVAQSEQQTKAPSPEKRCASNRTYDLIKRELFRRAAQLRGSDQAAFDQLSGFAVVRMENPVMESQDNSTGAVNCSGSVSLDLPPGVGIVGGRQTLTADVDYTVQPAADGSGDVVVLRNAESIVAPLATLERLNQPAPAAPAAGQGAPAELNGTAPNPSEGTPPQSPQQPQPTLPTGQTSSNGHPSFDCAKAHSKGQITVCSNAGLAALDRNMASQYVSAMSGASPEQKELLRRTRDRFMEYRDRCPNRTCIGEAYVGRMREIRDIMEGRWQPPR